jgi:hypothetical protein
MMKSMTYQQWIVAVETHAAGFAALCRSHNDLRFLKQFN